MSLPFLNLSPSSIAQAGTSLFSIASLMGNKNKPTDAERALQARQSQITGLTNSLNPDDPYNKYLVDQNANLQRMDMQRYLRDLMNANQRAALMGRQQIFDPERRDEAFSRYVTAGSQQIEPRARQNAQSQILTAINAANSGMGGLSTLASLQQNREDQNRQRFFSGVQGLNDLFSSGGNRGASSNGQTPIDTSQGLPWLSRPIDTSQGLPWLTTGGA